MKKIFWIAILILSALISYGQTVSMKSTTKGISIKADVGVVGWASEDLEIPYERGPAIGFRLSYGFNNVLEAFTEMNFAQIKPEDEFVDPFMLKHIDFGGKLNFGSSLNAIRPYTYVALTVFGSKQKILTDEWYNYYSTLKLSGTGATVGVGLKYHLDLPLAITFDASMTHGKYTKVVFDEETIPGKIDAKSYRMSLGVVVYFNQL